MKAAWALFLPLLLVCSLGLLVSACGAPAPAAASSQDLAGRINAKCETVYDMAAINEYTGAGSRTAYVIVACGGHDNVVKFDLNEGEH